MDIGHVHGVQHAPEHIQFEFKNFDSPILLPPAGELRKGQLQGVIDITMDFRDPVAEIDEARGVDPGVFLRPGGDALGMDGGGEQLG